MIVSLLLSQQSQKTAIINQFWDSNFNVSVINLRLTSWKQNNKLISISPLHTHIILMQRQTQLILLNHSTSGMQNVLFLGGINFLTISSNFLSCFLSISIFWLILDQFLYVIFIQLWSLYYAENSLLFHCFLMWKIFRKFMPPPMILRFSTFPLNINLYNKSINKIFGWSMNSNR